MSKNKDDVARIDVSSVGGDDRATTIAKSVLLPTVQAALSIKRLNAEDEAIDVGPLITALREQTNAVIGGNISRGEAMLTAQAHTLDALFNHLVIRATANMGQYLESTQTYMKLALKAQSQCRTTWEAISSIKNPKTAGYVRQQNIANGPQQINNGEGELTEKNSENEQSKLLEKVNGERLDLGTAATAESVDTGLEAVGTLNGT